MVGNIKELARTVFIHVFLARYCEWLMGAVKHTLLEQTFVKRQIPPPKHVKHRGKVAYYRHVPFLLTGEISPPFQTGSYRD
jgi:hypothetical protein